VGRLRDLLIRPLSLSEGTTRLLVSPEGPLSYLPFSALVPGMDVVCVPSGTTYGVLLEEKARHGTQVLALGDPDYAAKFDPVSLDLYAPAAAAAGPARGTRLSPLPGTREEAKAVGDVTLLGRDASEAALREALARKKDRWHAVHFACHGLVNPDRPTLSSLALTPDAQNDGFLTALEVLRAEIPSDLVVLSACETGTGKIVGGEGILGLTRAFMYAGTPRVLCSLWKVDDEATRALMTEFYALWNPKDGKRGLPTAEALRKAQEFVRGHEKWKHPYFWAAWVLWGLAD
jgi:CHAT domain-containing protein